jgi:hypothetical protein
MGQNEGDDEQEKRVWEREIVEGNKRKKVIKEMEKKTKERRFGEMTEMVQKLKKIRNGKRGIKHIGKR